MHKNSFFRIGLFFLFFLLFKPIIYINVGLKAKKQSGIGLLKVLRDSVISIFKNTPCNESKVLDFAMLGQ